VVTDITHDNGDKSDDSTNDVLHVVIIISLWSLQFPYAQDVFHTKQYIITAG